MPSIKQIIAERLKFMQGWSLALSYTIGTAYGERGKVKVSKMLYACTILLFMESCFDIVGRKTLSQSPSPSIESSKKIGAYIGSYHWRFISYVDCCVDTLVSIKESFIEKSHHWYSYESDSTVCIDNEYFHIVKLSKKHKNIILTDFIYSGAHMLTPLPSPTIPFGNHQFVFYVCLFLVCK